MTDIENGPAAQAAETSPMEDLRSVLAESQKEAPQPDVGTEGAAAETPADAAAAQRARDEKGRFAPKGDEAAAGDAEKAASKPAGEQNPDGAPEAGKTETGDQAAAAQPEAGAVEAPTHWSAADKQWLAGIPGEHQGAVLQRFKQIEAGFTPKLQRLAAYEREYQGVPEIFAPHAEALRQRGQTPAHVIQSWARVEQGLLNHKAAVESGQQPGEHAAEAVARMIAGYRIDPAAVASVLTRMANGEMPAAAQQQPGRSAVPPEVMEKLNRLERREQDREVAAYRQREASVTQTLNSLANEKDAEGNLKRPFFAELEEDMKLFAQTDISVGKTPDPSDLYERAVWANPSTREKLQSLQKEQADRRAQAEAKAKSERAAKAGVSVSGSPGATQATGSQSKSSASVNDDLRASLAELRG